VRGSDTAVLRIEAKISLGDRKMQSANVPSMPWRYDNASEIVQFVRAVADHVELGHPLKVALAMAEGRSSKRELAWELAVAMFKKAKLEGGTALSIGTWDKDYGKLLAEAVAMQTGDEPAAGAVDLIERLCWRPKWKPGSRSRQIGVRVLASFLRWAVERHHWPAADWLPPADLSNLIGAKAADDDASQASAPIADADIVDLIAAVAAETDGAPWADALKLIAELGLRPIEVTKLSRRMDHKVGAERWYVDHRKKGGRGATKPRYVDALPIDGTDWQLAERWAAGDIKLPEFKATNGIADSIRTWLRNKAAWNDLKAKYATELGENIACYGLRHAFSLRGHVLGLPSAVMADLMGHSELTHSSHYPWASNNNTANAVAAALAARSAT
jgi:integrase